MPRFQVARILGIPIYVDASWFLIFAFVTYALANQVFPTLLPDDTQRIHIALAGITSMIFFASILLHELAHSVVAKLYKIPVKSITLFLFGGVAQITREATKPFGELLMAAAGPLTSLAIGAVFLGSWWVFDMTTDSRVGAVFMWVGFINIVLGVFNFIPAFPMDGGRVFRALAWMVTKNYYLATRIAGWTGRTIAWAVIAAGMLSLSGVDMRVINGTFDAVWFIFIGFYLENMARQGLMQNKLVETLTKYRARDLMMADPPVVEGGTSIASLARGAIDINPNLTYFVEDEGVLAGILSGYQMRAVPEPQWHTTTARQAMLPSRRLTAVSPDGLANEILVEMETSDLSHLPVVSEGRVLGVIARERILRVLQKSGLLT